MKRRQETKKKEEMEKGPKDEKVLFLESGRDGIGWKGLRIVRREESSSILSSLGF